MIRYVSILAVTSSVAAVSANGPLWTLTRLRGAEPATLADALLPAGHSPIARVDVLPDASQVALYAQPARFDRGFCRAALFRVAVVRLPYATDASPEGPPYRPGAVTTSAVYRASAAPADCEADTRGYFPISGGSDADGRSLVRALIAIKAAAASGARIPPASCADRSGAGSCAGSRRALMAGVRIDAIGNVALKPCAGGTAAGSPSCDPQIWLGAHGGEPAYWIASLTVRGAGPLMRVTRIALVRESVTAP